MSAGLAVRLLFHYLDLGFRVPGSGFRVYGFRVWGGFRV